MKKRGNIQKLISFFLVFVMLFGVVFQSRSAFAEGLERVETKVTEFTVTTSAGEIPPDGFGISAALRIGISWDASHYQNELKEGDYFNVILPKEFIFPEDHSACNFNILAPNGTDVVAKAVVTPDTVNGGGIVKVTFTGYVAGKYNIKGSMFLNATFNQKYIKQGQSYSIAVAVGAHPVSTDINIKPPTSNPLNNESLSKWSRNKLFDGHVRWEMRINHRKGNLTNAVITDELTSEDGDLTGIHYIKGSFKLMEIKADEFGNTTWQGPSVDISDQVVFSDNDTKFRYSLGDISGKQYFLSYDTTFKPNIKLRNKVTLANEQETWISSSSAVFANSGGQGQGDLANKIKLLKVDAEDHSIVLANAVFEVTKPDGSKFELTTGTDGTITSGFLVQGKYKVKEKTPPVGYHLNGEEYEVEVTSEGGRILTVTNEPVRTKISVEKKWIGKPGSSVVAVLKADGSEVARKELSKENGWAHTFDNLRKYKAGTDTEIVYTVEEEAVPQGYIASCQKTSEGKWVITNTITGKVSVPVTKTWVGPAKENVTVELLADGVKVTDAVLNAGNNWQHTFADLDKYKDGVEIVYTIREVSVAGYSSKISGDQNGYTITNTNTETIEIPVEKRWVGAPAEFVTISLLADGVIKDTVELN
ncbi:MAG: Cna B-type domain-containing protein, partial [Lachnospiraceae bacterium]|nr:Cna B-type domain-containing protein [Lachnospiraceae bacterium]